MAQANHPALTHGQEEAARNLNNYMRKLYRRHAYTRWMDLDWILLHAHRMAGTARQDAVQAALHGFHRGGRRFDVWFSLDPYSPDGYQYEIRLRPHLYTNKHGR